MKACTLRGGFTRPADSSGARPPRGTARLRRRPSRCPPTGARAASRHAVGPDATRVAPPSAAAEKRGDLAARSDPRTGTRTGTRAYRGLLQAGRALSLSGSFLGRKGLQLPEVQHGFHHQLQRGHAMGPAPARALGGVGWVLGDGCALKKGGFDTMSRHLDIKGTRSSASRDLDL